MRCDFCNSSNTYINEHKHVYNIKGEEITFSSLRKFCSNCNKLVYDSELDDIASKKAIEIYNKKFGVTKEQILNLREKYNLSQQMFSKIIGCAKKTLISYEKGTSIPNDNYLIIIKSLISKPDTIITLIEANKDQFDEEEYLKIRDKLNIFYVNNNTKQLFLNDEFKPSEFNGYTKLNKDKIINMILFFADNCVFKTKLLKEMFYADFLYYKKTATSITGLEYAKLGFGPVPDGFEDILNNCTKDKKIDYQIEFINNYETHNITSKIKVNKNIFTKKEFEILNKVKEYFQNYTSSDIVVFSHKEKAFTESEFYKKISYDYAFDITSIE